MNSMAFSLLANSSPKVDGNQISFGTVDFHPHPPNFTPIFESLDQEMDLTIRSLNFRVGSLGSICLSDLAKPDPSASETKTITMSESSVGSSSEANSPVSFATAEIVGEKLKNSMKPWRISTYGINLKTSRSATMMLQTNQQTHGRQD
jgi:hypothetical protein